MSSSSEPLAVAGAFAFEQLRPAPPRPLAPPPGSADAALAEARAEVEAARAEAEAIREAARCEGLAEAREEALAAARAELAPAAEALRSAMVEMERVRDGVLDRVEAASVELGLAIAAKTVAGALEVQPARVLDVVRGALRHLVERERVVVQVHPGDLELVRAAAADLAQSLGGIESLEIQEERRVARGGAIVRTAVGDVDARLETKLERAREVLRAELSA